MDISFSLFSDVFEIKHINKDGKHFERVSRLDMVSETCEADLILDVHTGIYLVKPGERYTVTLASSLGKDSHKGPSLADKYDYVTHGKIFSIKEATNKITVYASFGGLMMIMTGFQSDLDKLTLDSDIYLLMRKA